MHLSRKPEPSRRRVVLSRKSIVPFVLYYSRSTDDDRPLFFFFSLSPFLYRTSSSHRKASNIDHTPRPLYLSSTPSFPRMNPLSSALNLTVYRLAATPSAPRSRFHDRPASFE